jgi:hypothetical protein
MAEYFARSLGKVTGPHFLKVKVATTQDRSAPKHLKVLYQARSLRVN